MTKIAITVVDTVAPRPRHIKLRLPDTKTIEQIAQFLARKYDHLSGLNFTLFGAGRRLDAHLTLKDVAATSDGAEVIIEVRAGEPAPDTKGDAHAGAGFADALAAFEAADSSAEAPPAATPPPAPKPRGGEAAAGNPAAPESASLADALAGLDDAEDHAASAPAPTDDPQAQPGETGQRETPYAGDAAPDVANALADLPSPADGAHATPLPQGDYEGPSTAGVADALAAVESPTSDAPPTPLPAGPYEGDPANDLADTLAVVDNVDPQPTALPAPEYHGPPAREVADQLAEDMPGPGVTPLPVGEYRGVSPAAMASALAEDPATTTAREPAAAESTETYLLSLREESEATDGEAGPASENEDFLDNRPNPSAALPVVHADDGDTAEVPLIPRGVPPTPGLRDVRAEDGIARERTAPPVIRELSGAEAERVRKHRRESERKSRPVGGRILRRRARVTYLERMTTHQVFPVTVDVTRELDEPRDTAEDSAAAQGAVPFEIEARRPVVSVRAVFPGCVVSTSQVNVDLAAERAQVRLWVTPIAAGEHYDGCVEIWQHGRRVESIATPYRVASRRTPLITALAGAVFPALSTLFALLRDTAAGALSAETGFLSYMFVNIWPGMALFVPLAGIAWLLWWKSRPREAMPKERPFACDDRVYEI